MDNSEEASSLSEEDALYIAKKNWSRVIEAASKSGYREGIEDGSESVFQEGFDKGYQDAFRTAFLLGKYKSLLNTTNNTPHPPDVEQILDKTRRGACRICQLESEQKKDPESIPFSEIVNQQRDHSAEVLQKLHQHFQPVIEQLGINMTEQ